MYKKINVKEALSLLINGKIVALPTETVYGLAGRIDKPKTIEKIFLLKKRPLFNPLIVHCYDTQQALECLSGNTTFIKLLLDYFSPGPLTVVGKKSNHISSLITAGKNTIAVRIPQHPLTRKVLKQLPVPLAAPSANPYSKISPVSAKHVWSYFKNRIPVLDGGICKKGLESTIVFPDLKKKKMVILRPGIITKKAIESFVHKSYPDWTVTHKSDPLQPGGQKSHYKPKASLYIIETEKPVKEIKKFLLKRFPNKQPKNLCLKDSPQKTAHLLYSRLRQLSNKKENLIFVQLTKQHQNGLWDTIWNRLNKAASAHYKL